MSSATTLQELAREIEQVGMDPAPPPEPEVIFYTSADLPPRYAHRAAYLPIRARDLPAYLVPSETNRDPPTVHYGLPMAPHTFIIAYAERTGLVPRANNFQHGGPSGMHLTLRAIKDIPGASRVYLESPTVPHSATQYGVVALYSNYDMYWRRPAPEVEHAVFEAIKEMLGVDPALEPAWFFNLHTPYIVRPEDPWYY